MLFLLFLFIFLSFSKQLMGCNLSKVRKQFLIPCDSIYAYFQTLTVDFNNSIYAMRFFYFNLFLILCTNSFL